MHGLRKIVLTVSTLLFLAPAGGFAQDCRICHGPGNVYGVQDFSLLYERRVRHHPSGIKYPAVPTVTPGFKTPSGHIPGVLFFDLNDNRLPDDNEVQLFGESGAAWLECASCHREHGTTPPSGNSAERRTYLRVPYEGSALCNTCHKF